MSMTCHMFPTSGRVLEGVEGVGPFSSCLTQATRKVPWLETLSLFGAHVASTWWSQLLA